jgi:hypothetical protein
MYSIQSTLEDRSGLIIRPLSINRLQVAPKSRTKGRYDIFILLSRTEQPEEQGFIQLAGIIPVGIQWKAVPTIIQYRAARRS